MSKPIACLGAWCESREKCADYHLGQGAPTKIVYWDGVRISMSAIRYKERLCGPLEQPSPMPDGDNQESQLTETVTG